ncbi:hypothetical protein A7K94_0214670, partial [Modestobacter sp. VKM Ac-2676]
MLTRAFDIAQGLAWPDRWPGRALVNEFTETWHGREAELRGDTRAAEWVHRAPRRRATCPPRRSTPGSPS